MKSRIIFITEISLLWSDHTLFAHITHVMIFSPFTCFSCWNTWMVSFT